MFSVASRCALNGDAQAAEIQRGAESQVERRLQVYRRSAPGPHRPQVLSPREQTRTGNDRRVFTSRLSASAARAVHEAAAAFCVCLLDLLIEKALLNGSNLQIKI